MLDAANTLEATNNIVSFFDKLSETFLRLSVYCPRYSEYRLLFGDSTRLQKALCDFYASIISFCTKAIQAIEKPGNIGAVTVEEPTLINLCIYRIDSHEGTMETV